MGNLGAYQLVTSLSKKVGGPINLFLMTLVSGYIAGKSGELVVKKLKKDTLKKHIDSYEVFDVVTEGEINDGLALRVGDKFKILESDGDSVLIEIIGNTSNPYFVSSDFLKNISSYIG